MAAEVTRYVVTVYNNRSETSYSFGPVTERSLDAILKKIERAGDRYGTPDVAILNSASLFDTGMEMALD